MRGKAHDKPTVAKPYVSTMATRVAIVAGCVSPIQQAAAAE
jgi:hypothetical protein